MRAVWYDRQGPANEVIVTGELPTPEPGTGQVRVRLEASGVNPADTYRRRGAVPPEYPRVIPNSDGAGVIDKTGDGIPQAWVGKRVWLYNGQRNGRWMGTAAEYIALDADLVTELPDEVSFAQGATLGIPAMTAHGCVFAAGPVQGKTLLITGGAGAVGHYAVQLAAWAGARVIATVSSAAKAAHAKAAGADVTIDYKTEDVAARVRELTNGRGVERIVEVDLGANMAADVACIATNGTIASYSSTAVPEPVLPYYPLAFKGVTVRLVQGFNLPEAARRAAIDDITRWSASGRVRHAVAARFPLADIALAHEALEQGRAIGNIVVEIE